MSCSWAWMKRTCACAWAHSGESGKVLTSSTRQINMWEPACHCKPAPTLGFTVGVLEGLAEVQVHRLLIVIIEPVAEIQRSQRCVKPQENARGVDIAAVELIVVVPRPSAFQ